MFCKVNAYGALAPQTLYPAADGYKRVMSGITAGGKRLIIPPLHKMNTARRGGQTTARCGGEAAGGMDAADIRKKRPHGRGRFFLPYAASPRAGSVPPPFERL